MVYLVFFYQLQVLLVGAADDFGMLQFFTELVK
jgi:hypothetical protein